MTRSELAAVWPPTASAAREAGHKPQSPLRAIREKCRDCSCYQLNEIRACAAVKCPLWPFRAGKHPWWGEGEKTCQTLANSELQTVFHDEGSAPDSAPDAERIHDTDRVPPNRIKLTRAQRHRMQKLADEVDVVSQADRRFFVRRPDRQHRVRLASRAEIEQMKIAGGEPMTAPPGCRFFTVVRNIATGARMRFLVLNREDAETDLPETMARAIWEAAATPYMREIEAQLHKAAGARA